MTLTSDQRREIAELAARLDAAPRGARSTIVQQFASARGKSAATVWRWLRFVRGASRKARRDAGATRTPAEELEQVLLVKEQTRFADPRLGREWMGSTEMAVKVALAEGRISSEISPSTVNRFARAKKLDRRARRTITRPKRARAANDVHTFDASQTKMLRLVGVDENGRHLVGARPREGYRRNRGEEPMSLWVVGVVDDHSSVMFGEYRVAAGESYEVVFDVLSAAWSGDPRSPIRGLPRTVNADLGPFVQKAESGGLFEALGVERLNRMPDSPNVSGKIESRWPDAWTGFEVWLARTPDRVMTLETLNAEFAAFLAERNARPHPWELTRSREDVYTTSLAGQEVRLMPEDAGLSTWQQRVRRVTEYGTVRVQNQHYRVDDDLLGEWVECHVLADGRAVAMRPSTGETFEMTPAALTDWGEFDARHKTPLERLADRAAEDETPKAESAWAGDGQPRVIQYRPAGSEVEMDTPVRRHERARRYANIEEGRRDARSILGFQAYIENPGLTERIDRLLNELELDRETCRDALLELAADAG